MTDKTGPAQQRDQPTQLTADECAELHRLTRAYGDAKFAKGMVAMQHPRDEDKYKRAEDESDAALLALNDWQRAHGLTAAIMFEATP